MVKIVLGKKPEQSGQGNNPFGPGRNKNNDMQAMNANPSEEMGAANRRIKMLEERYTNLRSKVQLTEHNMLTKNKNFFTDIKAVNLEMTEIKKEINEVKDNMVKIVKEMESLARREDVEVLRKYIDLWNPLNFVTKTEAERIVRDVIDKMRREQ